LSTRPMIRACAVSNSAPPAATIMAGATTVTLVRCTKQLTSHGVAPELRRMVACVSAAAPWREKWWRKLQRDGIGAFKRYSWLESRRAWLTEGSSSTACNSAAVDTSLGGWAGGGAGGRAWFTTHGSTSVRFRLRFWPGRRNIKTIALGTLQGRSNGPPEASATPV
jgi:hypothetical protein